MSSDIRAYNAQQEGERRNIREFLAAEIAKAVPEAAQARYTEAPQITTADLRRCLEKAKGIQWDYRNIVKRRGELVRL